MKNEVVLTKSDVLAKCKGSSLSDVVNLNFWGRGITNIDIVSELENVETIALSNNCVSSLRVFHGCKKLKELFIRKNSICDLKEIDYLVGLPNLVNLWLTDNPVTNVEGYRRYVIFKLPQLTKLDEVDVLPEERVNNTCSFAVLEAITKLLPSLTMDELNELEKNIVK